tara:strand:- start:2764 stop:3120 length:357 start_codon:yes stop_codon:yes gene_type:complete
LNFKFSKNNRLLSANDFSYLKENASFAKSGLFLFFHKPSLKSDGKTRIGISISSKNCNAVKRNLLKRKIREFFRHSDYKDLNRDIVIVLNKRRFKTVENALLKLETDLNNGFKLISNS